MRCFQLLDVLHKSKKCLKTGKSKRDMYVCSTVEFFDIRQPSSSGVLMDVFAEPDVSEVDLVKLAPFATLQDGMLKWEPTESDAVGCIALRSPQAPLISLGDGGLMSPKAPSLLLLEDLHRNGWRPTRERQALAPLTIAVLGVFSRDRLKARQQTYFRCLVGLEGLFGRGPQTFDHTQKVSYYELILRVGDPSAVPLNMPEKDYTKQLRGSGFVFL